MISGQRKLNSLFFFTCLGASIKQPFVPERLESLIPLGAIHCVYAPAHALPPPTLPNQGYVPLRRQSVKTSQSSLAILHDGRPQFGCSW